MIRPVLLLLLVAILGADVYLFGTWTNRWAPSGELERAVDRLKQVPLDVGEWKSEELQLKERHLKHGEIDGYLYRDYRHERTGETFNVILLCGRSGPISVHTPDICFTGLGYRPEKKETVATVTPLGAEPARLWTADFTKDKAAAANRLQIFWTWSLDGAHWDTPDNPRLAYPNRPALYKLYVTRQLTSTNRGTDDALANEFLGVLLPQLERALSPASPPPAADTPR